MIPYFDGNRLNDIARRTILCILVLALLTSKLFAQEAQNIADLDFLYHQIQELPSYKDQFRGEKSYHNLYEKIRKDLRATDEIETYQKLLLLIQPINDNHLGLWRKSDSKASFSPLRMPIDTTEVKNKNSSSYSNSIEGIYINSDGSKRVLFEFKPDVYYLQNFNTGIIEAILNHTTNDSYDVVLFIGSPVPYVLNRNLKIQNGKLGNLNFYKLGYRLAPPLTSGHKKFEYRELKPEIGYLRLGNFNSSNDNFKVAKAFYDSIRTKITTQYIIVDLRNNLGGGYRTSKQFLTLLKKYHGRIFLLQNNNTVSNAEQFIIDIRSKKKLITLGETTRGTITYGSNYGKTVSLPSGRFIFYPTDMKGRKKDLIYESIGIRPDIILDPFGDDWIEQTLNYVNNERVKL
ncbi:S41 family peptidase [Pedobacter sp. BMA]|uniref:S41 family peptidase n=1 Tax=Pedobacter sp. BMA TaxID=1663685 RepID=UPI00069D4AA3|nr:S41 family peptidase [Pedobacter sp. BMA]